MATPPHPVLDRHPEWRAYADKHGLSCLEQEWMGGEHRYTLVCAQGHAHQRNLGWMLRTAKPCKPCADATWLFDKMCEEVARVGVRCLSKTWQGSGACYRFRCNAGHEWERRRNKLRDNPHCKVCRRLSQPKLRLRADALEAVQAKAVSMGGICESTENQGSLARYRFRCAAGHAWEASGTDVLRDAWCLLCAHDKKRLSLADAQALAHSRGGRCLSEVYKSSEGENFCSERLPG